MIESLQKALETAPVMGEVHPLWPLCLPHDVEIVTKAQVVVERLDALEQHSEKPILITEYDPRFTGRFLTKQMPNCPSATAINDALPKRLKQARHLLTHKQIAQRIYNDAVTHRYETVALMLVDGLSYEDVKHWPERATPCFIDGPSITFTTDTHEQILNDVGFPAIIGSPPLARRLVDVGLAHSRGYSYWDREDNDVSDFLFAGMPLAKVESITEAIDTLKKQKLKGLYLQLVREGTDGLAHSRRELTDGEVTATVSAIHQDFQLLVQLIAEREVRGAVYLTSDHGVLWKHQHDFVRLAEERATSPRYTRKQPFHSQYTTSSETQAGEYYLYHYPYIGRKIRTNDSGVHGGLSYWESIVPFVHVEVNV